MKKAHFALDKRKAGLIYWYLLLLNLITQEEFMETQNTIVPTPYLDICLNIKLSASGGNNAFILVVIADVIAAVLAILFL